MQGLLSGSYSSNYSLLLAETNSGFRRTDTASTWLTGSMKIQHGHRLQCALKKWASMPAKDRNYFKMGLLYKMLFRWEKWNKTLSLHFSIISLLRPAHPRWPKAFLLTPDSAIPVLHSCWSPAPVRLSRACHASRVLCKRHLCTVSPSCGLSHCASCPCSKWAEGKGRRAQLWTDSSPSLIFSYPKGPWS